MFWTIIQYLFIAIVFVVAIAYIIKMTRDSLGSKKTCAKGCGCDDPSTAETSLEKKK